MTITRRAGAAFAVTGVLLAGVGAPSVAAQATSASEATAQATRPAPGHPPRTSTKAKKVKHVWLIILENKSYDSTFTGLNRNSYLWKTLPAQGALLKNYYGTGHYSQDNYMSLVSGQSQSMDLQEDCDVANTDLGTNKHIIRRHDGKKFGADDNYGQVLSPAGPNAPDGTNGCTYPKQAATLFNQFDAAGVRWKGLAQDLHAVPGREDGLGGAPGSRDNDPTRNPKSMTPSDADKAAGITSYTGAQANDQYVAKHFPFPWFHSIIGDDNTGKDALTTPAGGGTDTDASHIANLDDPANGLLADLRKPASQAPQFTWLTPNNCSDAHDAVCKGNNLSGLFDANGNPDYSKPLDTPPKNHTGGLYAADLWLKYYVPLIERSKAFKDDGLIDVTFDEANPPFYNMSFNNATDPTATAAKARKHMRYTYGQPTAKELAEGRRPYRSGVFPKGTTLAQDYLKADRAGQNIDGRNVPWQPTGPNSTLATDRHGNQLYPGPGNNGFITRPPSCEQDSTLVDPQKTNCVHGARNTGSASGYTKAASMPATAAEGGTTVKASVNVADTGRAVTGAGVPAGSYVGQVVNRGPKAAATATDPVADSSFTLVDGKGKPVRTTGVVAKITLSATGIPGHLRKGETPLATFDAKTPTPGGGITGSVLISPLIKPGTVSTVNYNHYSWLRTMEDMFGVARGKDRTPLAAGSVSGGLDGQGHLGFAAQAGLRPFGRDVFTNAGR